MKHTVKIFAPILAAGLCAGLFSCANSPVPPVVKDTDSAETTGVPGTTAAPDTIGISETAAPETKTPETTVPVTTKAPETTAPETVRTTETLAIHWKYDVPAPPTEQEINELLYAGEDGYTHIKGSDLLCLPAAGAYLQFDQEDEKLYFVSRELKLTVSGEEKTQNGTETGSRYAASAANGDQFSLGLGETVSAGGNLYRAVFFTSSSGTTAHELLSIPREWFASEGVFAPRTTYRVISYENDFYVTGNFGRDSGSYVFFSNSVLHFVDLPRDCVDALCYYRSYDMLPVFDGEIGVTAVRIVGKFGWSGEENAAEDAVYRYYITTDRGMNWLPYEPETNSAPTDRIPVRRKEYYDPRLIRG